MDRSGVGSFGTSENEYFAHSLDVFELPKTEKLMHDGLDVFYNPIATLSDEGPYEFLINRDLECHFYLPRTRLHGAFKIVKTDGTDIPVDADVSIANLMSHNLFKQIELYINGTQVVDLSSPTYPWKAFIENFLTYSGSVKRTSLRSALYHEDDAETYPGIWKTSTTQANSALKTRQKWISASKRCEFVTPLHIDFLNCDLLLPPNLDIKFRFTRHNSNFGLLTDAVGDYKIKLIDLKLEMRKVLCDIETRKQFMVKLIKKPAIFPYSMTKIRTYVLPQGITSQTITNIVSGRLPRQIIIGFLNTESLSGSPKYNPFYFHHFNVTNICLRINGQNYPSQPLKPDFANGICMREFRHTIDNIGVQGDNISVGFDYERFQKSKTLFGFDLTPDQCNGAHLHENK